MRLPEFVEVETSRFCNRSCAWCPNHFLPDRRRQELMGWSMLESILRSLARQCYRGWLAFHNYNEPLANPRLRRELALARSLLPGARLTIYTNGDYLNASLFGDLVSLGLTEMRITVYPPHSGDPTASHERLWSWLGRHPFLDTAGWSEVLLRQGPALTCAAPIALQLISPDVTHYYDRGGALPAWSIRQRSTVCALTSRSLSIDYRGDVKMCCNVVSHYAPHAAYIFGNVRDLDLTRIWDGARFGEVRLLHLRGNWASTPICATCSQQLPP